MRFRTLPWMMLALACGSPPPEPAPAPSSTPEPAPAPEPVPEPSIAPAPSATTVPTPDDDHGCAADDDCVLVADVCGGLEAANRERAPHLQLRYEAFARATECERRSSPEPIVPHCASGACTTRPADDSDALACAASADCVALHGVCRWILASRAAPGFAAVEARSRAPHDGREPPCTMSPMPTLECRWGFCSDVRALVPL